MSRGAKKTSPSRRAKSAPALLYNRSHNGGMVFAPKRLALYVANLHRALKKARTWGEFRRMIPRGEYSKVIRASFDDIGERRPRSTDAFSAEQVTGWSDGDYPMWLQQDMDLYLPNEVLRQFGTHEDTMLNGSFWMIPPENTDSVIHALEERGFRVEDGRKLPFW